MHDRPRRLCWISPSFGTARPAHRGQLDQGGAGSHRATADLASMRVARAGRSQRMLPVHSVPAAVPSILPTAVATGIARFPRASWVLGSGELRGLHVSGRVSGRHWYGMPSRFCRHRQCCRAWGYVPLRIRQSKVSRSGVQGLHAMSRRSLNRVYGRL